MAKNNKASAVSSINLLKTSFGNVEAKGEANTEVGGKKLTESFTIVIFNDVNETVKKYGKDRLLYNFYRQLKTDVMNDVRVNVKDSKDDKKRVAKEIRKQKKAGVLTDKKAKEILAILNR